ncbi:hypothetical protein GOP47_0028415 [Adiantum capillus-veneris]|nr:hypothetical protein GOP47_0028415 [Adiantum capillus-veneris]
MERNRLAKDAILGTQVWGIVLHYASCYQSVDWHKGGIADILLQSECISHQFCQQHTQSLKLCDGCFL